MDSVSDPQPAPPPVEVSQSSRMKTLLGVAVVSLIVLVIVLDGQRRSAVAQLTQLTSEYNAAQVEENAEQNEERAREIVEAVSRHIYIPTDVEPTVANVVDAQALKTQNSFYQDAVNGDYVIITRTRAILWDPVEDKIRDVAVVQIQPNAASSLSVSSTSAAASPSGAPKVDETSSVDAQ